MLTNVTNLNAVPVAANVALEQSPRRRDGRLPGHLLLFAACPQCGARMNANTATGYFFCYNHNGDWLPKPDPLGINKEKRGIGVTLVFEHIVHTGAMRLTGAKQTHTPNSVSQTTEPWDKSNELKGLYPVTVPAGTI
jgi:hypothetical protein